MTIPVSKAPIKSPARYYCWQIKSPIEQLGAFTGSDVPFMLYNPKMAMLYAVASDEIYMQMRRKDA